ncbi:Monooxygenase FAD-binding protein [Botryosphaeria dothidea]|uniref:Monooxygenase FAD-binding protein n=1 Tax=Botryosphaeria dothidea TaxID=55169 RepID=A0A8H4J0V8_9PEZI|nr:Monooxygenase FAD-binding protein [Botryosphaeria dothidea]
MAEPQHPPFKVIIIGAGLSGSLLANGLLHASVPVTVYERDEENAKREGYQIHLGESTLVGMRACLSAAQIASVVQKFGRVGGRKGQASVIRHKDFRLLLDLKAFPDYSKSAPINRKVLRDTLAALLARVGVVKYEKRFVRYEIVADGGRERVRVHFQDGESDECDVLIGADGSVSKVNCQLGLNNISEINTHVNLLVKQDLPTEKLLALGREFTSGPILSMADNQNFYFSAYVPENSDKSGFDEFSSCSVGAALPIETAPPNINELSPKEKWDFVSRSITGWAPQFHRALDVARDSNFHTYIARTSSRPPRDWRNKVRSDDAQRMGHPRVWLMGDAMHAMFPYRGQGGNQAMRDAAVALPLLIDLAEKAKTGDLNDKHVEDACQAFEDEMIPRTFEWVKKSGGREIIPFNSSKLSTRILFAIASKLVWVARLWYFVKHTFGFSRSSNLDDAPELRE